MEGLVRLERNQENNLLHRAAASGPVSLLLGRRAHSAHPHHLLNRLIGVHRIARRVLLTHHLHRLPSLLRGKLRAKHISIVHVHHLIGKILLIRRQLTAVGHLVHIILILLPLHLAQLSFSFWGCT